MCIVSLGMERFAKNAAVLVLHTIVTHSQNKDNRQQRTSEHADGDTGPLELLDGGGHPWPQRIFESSHGQKREVLLSLVVGQRGWVLVGVPGREQQIAVGNAEHAVSQEKLHIEQC